MRNPDTLIAFDPGSRVTGYAVFDGARLVDAGRIKPPSLTEPPAQRMLQVCGLALMLCDQHKPAKIVVEVPSARVSRHQRRIGGHGLTVFGFAAGALWSALVASSKAGVVETVDPHVWTNRKTKAARARMLAATEPGYRGSKDPGLDAADAIEIGRYWLAKAAAEAAKAAG